MIRGNPQLLIFAGINIIIMIWLFTGSSNQEESGIIGWIHYVFKHYLFVLTGIALIAAILNMIFPTGIEANISLIGLMFATSCCIVGRDLVKGEIYFGNKLIFPKDVVFR